MIVQENITINDKLFVKTYSDAEFYIKKKCTDEVYVEAIDLPTSNFEYVETEDKIEKPEEVDTEKPTFTLSQSLAISSYTIASTLAAKWYMHG